MPFINIFCGGKGLKYEYGYSRIVSLDEELRFKTWNNCFGCHRF